jgi:hypothetical protein
VNVVVFVVRLVLAAVFVVAAVGKAADLAGSQRAVQAFGVPRSLASVIGTLLPLAELGVAVALLYRGWARGGALAAFVLLAALSVAIARLIATGRTPDCHCFGRVHSEAAGILTVCRSSCLALAAGVVVLAGPGAGWRDAAVARHPAALAAAIGGAILLCVIALQARFAYRLLRRHGQLLIRLEELEARPAHGLTSCDSNQTAGSAQALALPLPAYDGSTHSLAELGAPGPPLLIMFSDPGCGPCVALLPDLRRWQTAHSEIFRLIVMTRGSAEGNRAAISAVGAEAVLCDRDRSVMSALDIPGTPAAILLDRRGQPGMPAALGAGAIRRVVDQAVARTKHIEAGSRPAEALDFSSSQPTSTRLEVIG